MIPWWSIPLTVVGTIAVLFIGELIALSRDEKRKQRAAEHYTKISKYVAGDRG